MSALDLLLAVKPRASGCDPLVHAPHSARVPAGRNVPATPSVRTLLSSATPSVHTALSASPASLVHQSDASAGRLRAPATILVLPLCALFPILRPLLFTLCRVVWVALCGSVRKAAGVASSSRAGSL